MDRARELSIGFLRSHREGAAPVLEGMTPEDAAAYLKDIPYDAGAGALEIMQPPAAAAILAGVTRQKAAQLLLAMDVHSRSRIMRLWDDALLESVLNRMPKDAARDLARFLKYPEGSAGAWVSSDVAVFEKSTAVRDCLARLRALPTKVRNLVFVVDAQGKFFGTVDLAELLAAPDDNRLDALADPAIKRLSPYASLTSIVALAAWDTALSLPVVDSKGRVLGALHFDRLREGLASERRTGTGRHMGQIMAHLGEAFLVCAAGILQGPAAKPSLSRLAGGSET